jgi:membrane protein required for colicin V production
MNTIDWIIIGIVSLSTLISLKRGFVKEALSLVTWIAAFLIARLFSTELAPLLTEYISSSSTRLVAAFALLFVATLIVGAMINHLVGELVRLTGLSGTDRMFGTIFGLARGLMILVVVVALTKLTPLTEDKWWKESIIIPELLKLEQRSREVFSEFSDDEAVET